MIDICAVGGYSEFGRNMTAVKIDDEVIIIDMGIHLEHYIKLQGSLDFELPSIKKLIATDSIPHFEKIYKWKHNVKAIIPTHAHLDHVGAIPYIANKYDAPIYCTPFTGEVIKALLEDKRKTLKNQLHIKKANSTFAVSKNITVEFINVTHSTPDTVFVAIHTKYGTLLYCNDFKFDSAPTLGMRPSFERIKKLENVLAMVVDCTRAWDEKKTPSESVAKEMLKDVMLGTNAEHKAIVVTTFSSHIARLKSIVEFGHKLGRNVVMLGRSLDKYVDAAKRAKIYSFENVEILKYKESIIRKLKKIARHPEKYVMIVTGHQGEPEAILARMTYGELHYPFNAGDHIIFSCSVIPNEENIKDRDLLESKLKKQRVRIFKDIHVSGHAAKEDLRDLVSMVRPKHLIPAHGDKQMMNAFVELALEMDYKKKKIHLLQNGDILKLR